MWTEGLVSMDYVRLYYFGYHEVQNECPLDVLARSCRLDIPIRSDLPGNL